MSKDIGRYTTSHLPHKAVCASLPALNFKSPHRDCQGYLTRPLTAKSQQLKDRDLYTCLFIKTNRTMLKDSANLDTKLFLAGFAFPRFAGGEI